MPKYTKNIETIICALLKCAADHTVKTKSDGLTHLELAVQHGQDETVHLLQLPEKNNS